MSDQEEYEAPEANLVDATDGQVPDGMCHYDVCVYIDDAGRRCYEFSSDDGVVMTIAIPNRTLVSSIEVMVELFPKMLHFVIGKDTEVSGEKD